MTTHHDHPDLGHHRHDSVVLAFLWDVESLATLRTKPMGYSGCIGRLPAGWREWRVLEKMWADEVASRSPDVERRVYRWRGMRMGWKARWDTGVPMDYMDALKCE